MQNFDPAKGTVKTWMRLYACHRSLNRWKYLNLRKHYEAKEISDTQSQQELSRSNGWGDLTFQECARFVEQGMKRLTPKQRTALELAFFRGLLLVEIADHTQDSLPNVRHHYYRGLQKLRRIMLEKPHAADTRPTVSEQEAAHVKP